MKNLSAIILGTISHRGINPLVVLNSHVTGENYVRIRADHLPPIVQTVFPDKRPVFHDHNVPIPTCKIARNWFYEHNDECSPLRPLNTIQ